MVLKACDIQHCYPQAAHMKEAKTAIYCYLHHYSSLLLGSAPLPPLLAHDKRVIDSETDTLGCFLATYQQQSLSSSFRSLSGLMKDRRWNSMAVIATIAPTLFPLPPPRTCLWPHSSLCSPHISGFRASTMLIPNVAAVSYLDFCSISMGPLCFGESDVSATSVNIYGFVLRTQEPCSLHCSSCQWMHSVSKDKKCAFISSQTLSLPLSGILMISMNNILQVSSRSSLELPRRKLSNSRQVIPLCSSSVLKVALNDSLWMRYMYRA